MKYLLALLLLCTAAHAAEPIRINTGGPAYTEPDGTVWAADSGCTGGSTYNDGSAIGGTEVDPIFQSERYAETGDLSCSYVVPNGDYAIHLYFSEHYVTAAGQRTFGVKVNGDAARFPKVDVFARSGLHGSLSATSFVKVTDGKVQIDLTRQVQNPFLHGIEIIPRTANLVCRPSDADVLAGRWRVLDVDSTVSKRYAKLAIWVDRCTGKLEDVYGTWSDVAKLLSRSFKSDEELKTWTASQPIDEPRTPSETTFADTMRANYSPSARVKPSGTAGSAPVYGLKGDGTRNTTPLRLVNGIPVRADRDTRCDMTKRIGTTSYYWVPAVNGYATCSVVSPLANPL